MPNRLLVGLAALPVVIFLLPAIVPARYLESYAWWSAASLNGDNGTVWRNVGYWEGTRDFSTAAEALARRLLEFADVPEGGIVLGELMTGGTETDMAHGNGESLSLHLSQSPPPKQLHSLTSLPSETRNAKELVARRFPNSSTEMVWYTTSAEFKAGNIHHPLDQMRGYLGRGRSVDFDDGDDEDNASERDPTGGQPTGPEKYDLVYILDAIYHFPPSVPPFLSSVLPTLAPGGVVVYTDILPPSDASSIPGSWLLSPLLGVPSANLFKRPKEAEDYKRILENLGYVDVRIEDWSKSVWPGFSRNLIERGGMWKWVGRAAEMAHKSGWRYLAIRAARPPDDV